MAKPAPHISIADQIEGVAEAVRQAAAEHAAMSASMKKIEALAERQALAVSKYSAGVSSLLEKAGSANTQAGVGALTKLRALQAAFNSQYLLLQSQMQRENQVFTAVSNVLKTRHDTVKNSIGNIR